MSIQTVHDTTLQGAQHRAASLQKGEPYQSLPMQSLISAIAKHGGMYTLLDADLITARMGALSDDNESNRAFAEKLQASATSYFYKLVNKPGYNIHSELMAYLCEPGSDNGVTYNTGVQPSDIPAVFTFVGQFIDHDLTFNGMNLTADETGAVVQDVSSPTIDLDSVYGPRPNINKSVNKKVFDSTGKFIHEPVTDPKTGKFVGYDVPRHSNKHDHNDGVAYIFDPRNDENELILQVHILVQRLHNKLIDAGFPQEKLGKDYNADEVHEIINCVRAEVVATWQSFILNDYMPRVIRAEILEFVLSEIKKTGTEKEPQLQYGSLKHKPYRDLVTGLNVVRMPHEFAIGFRFGHSQLRPMYLLNSWTPYVLLFRDARLSEKVRIDLPLPGPNNYIEVDGTDDLRGHRPLPASHVIEWSVFYPQPESEDKQVRIKTHSLLIDHNITARVFNLPESAIPDDIKYIGNLVHRNLIRSSQIGIVAGEELARFYGYEIVPHEFILRDVDAASKERVTSLFKLSNAPEHVDEHFRTPLWYYLLQEAEYDGEKDPEQLGKLGKVGSRLVAEVLAGAMYYANVFPFDDNWTSFIPAKSNKIMLTDIIQFVETEVALPAKQ